MSADLHAEIKQTVYSIIEEKMEGIDVMSEINNSTRVYDKLDEISTKLSLLINEFSQLNLQTVTVNNLATTNTQYHQELRPSPNLVTQPSDVIELITLPPKNKTIKPDKVFIPTLDTSNMEITNNNKKSTKFEGDDFLNNLNALDNLK